MPGFVLHDNLVKVIHLTPFHATKITDGLWLHGKGFEKGIDTILVFDQVCGFVGESSENFLFFSWFLTFFIFWSSRLEIFVEAL
jgi:hypothetical protein